MLTGLPVEETPPWLRNLNDVWCPIDPEKVFSNTVFSPTTIECTVIIRLLGKSFHNFIYSVAGQEPSGCMGWVCDNHIMIRDLRAVDSRSIGVDELAFDHFAREVVVQKTVLENMCKGMTGEANENAIAESGWRLPRLSPWWFLCDDGNLVRNGQSCRSYSILRIKEEAHLVYQRLYWVPETVPSLVALIEPQFGYPYSKAESYSAILGLEKLNLEHLQDELTASWEEAADPEGLFCKTVMDNPAGLPEYLLVGGSKGKMDYSKPLWPEYTELLSYGSESGSVYSLWRVGQE